MPAEITRMGYDLARDCLFVFRADGERKYYAFSRPLHDAIVAYGEARGEGDAWRVSAEDAIKTAKEVKWE